MKKYKWIVGRTKLQINDKFNFEGGQKLTHADDFVGKLGKFSRFSSNKTYRRWKRSNSSKSIGENKVPETASILKILPWYCRSILKVYFEKYHKGAVWPSSWKENCKDIENLGEITANCFFMTFAICLEILFMTRLLY